MINTNKIVQAVHLFDLCSCDLDTRRLRDSKTRRIGDSTTKWVTADKDIPSLHLFLSVYASVCLGLQRLPNVSDKSCKIYYLHSNQRQVSTNSYALPFGWNDGLNEGSDYGSDFGHGHGFVHKNLQLFILHTQIHR